MVLNDIINQLDLTDIYRTLDPKTTECTLFSTAHGMFSRIDHMVGHKRSFNKFKRKEIPLSIFSDHISMKLEISYKEKNGKSTNV